MWENIWQFFPTTKQENPSISWVTQILRVRGIPLKKMVIISSFGTWKTPSCFFFDCPICIPVETKNKSSVKHDSIALISFIIYQKKMIWDKPRFAHSSLIFQCLGRSISTIHYLTWGYLDGIPGLGSAVNNHGLPWNMGPTEQMPWTEVTMQQWKRVVASGIWPCSFYKYRRSWPGFEALSSPWLWK